MISEKLILNTRNNFLLASKDFQFEFISPMPLSNSLYAFGYIENYGSANGAIMILCNPNAKEDNSDEEVIEWCKKNNYF